MSTRENKRYRVWLKKSWSLSHTLAKLVKSLMMLFCSFAKILHSLAIFFPLWHRGLTPLHKKVLKSKELCIYSSSDSCFFLQLHLFYHCSFFFLSHLLIPIQGHEVLHFTQLTCTPAPQRKGPELWHILNSSQCIAICMTEVYSSDS